MKIGSFFAIKEFFFQWLISMTNQNRQLVPGNPIGSHNSSFVIVNVYISLCHPRMTLNSRASLSFKKFHNPISLSGAWNEIELESGVLISQTADLEPIQIWPPHWDLTNPDWRPAGSSYSILIPEILEFHLTQATRLWGYCIQDSKTHIPISPQYLRPCKTQARLWSS